MHKVQWQRYNPTTILSKVLDTLACNCERANNCFSRAKARTTSLALKNARP
jgi:hypothetical protein